MKKSLFIFAVLVLPILIVAQAFVPEKKENSIFSFIRNKDRQTVSSLLKRDKTLLKEKDKKGQTPLLAAVFNKDLDMVYMIHTKFSAPLTSVGTRGNVFHVAAENQDEPMLKLLVQLSNAADPELLAKLLNQQRSLPDDLSTVSDDGRTPLHVAAKNCNRKIYNFMVRNGADEDIKDQFDKTPRKMNESCKKMTEYKAQQAQKKAVKK